MTGETDLERAMDQGAMKAAMDEGASYESG